MEFKKYQHVEKLGHPEVEGLLDGECYVFSKLDGTNASVWADEEGNICAGSRNRQLSLENDNVGFYAWVKENNLKFANFFHWNPYVILYGEWLVKHSFKEYDDNAWRDFYVFDVVEYYNGEIKYWEPCTYMTVMELNKISTIPLIAKITNPTEESLLKLLDKATFKVKDGKGPGEGIVVKNYDFVNKYGRTTWGKIVRNEFKAMHGRTMPTNVHTTVPIEQKIVDQFVSDHMVDKVYSKLVNEIGYWESKMIPRLLNTVYYDLINEETWNYVKEFKQPTIDFKRLFNLCSIRVKQAKKELF